MNPELPAEPEVDAEVEKSPTLVINDKAYDLLRFVALLALPALGAAYFALAAIIGLPAAEQVIGSITVIDTLLGTLLGSMRRAYAKSDARYGGSIMIEPDEEEGITNMNVSLDPKAVYDKNEVLVKIKKP